MRICLVTSYGYNQEPRAPRHALALAAQFPKSEVIFIESKPQDQKCSSTFLDKKPKNLKIFTHFYPSKYTPVKLVIAKTLQLANKIKFYILKKPSPIALSIKVIGLEKKLKKIKADIYLSHNIETLLPCFNAVKKNNAIIIFDSMEFHSDMGSSQSENDKKNVTAIEKKCLPFCNLVLSSSPEVAKALQKKYNIKMPLSLENVAPVEKRILKKPKNGLHLYWRNSVIGLGQRGLEDILVSLKSLPEDIILHLQGNLGFDHGRGVKKRIGELEIGDRVIFHDPYKPHEAVREASKFHVGLCLERSGCKNHEFTTSNKIYDYHMAGMAVIASDLPGLRGVIKKSGGGLVFVPGSVPSLTKVVLSLYNDKKYLRLLAKKARKFALREANRRVVMKTFNQAMEKLLNMQ